MRPTRIAARSLGGAVAVLIAIIATAGPAFAHVTIQPSTVQAGATDVELTFRVPNEMDNARTIEMQVFLPSNLPLLTVDVLPVPGWSEHTTETKLRNPVSTDDGLVSEVVSQITWSAVRGGGIGAGQYEAFPVLVGAMPSRPGEVVLKALQTYSNGQVVRWIQLTTPGEPAPDTPAPVLTISAAAAPGTVSATTTAGGAHPGGGGSGNAGTIAIIAVGVAIVALVAAMLALLRGRNQAEGESSDESGGLSPPPSTP